jgi:DNA-binding NarL/FixJ family response regulator
MKPAGIHQGYATRIVLAEDHTMIRQSLKLLLETQRDWTVVAEAGNGIEALQAVREHEPDILVLDLLMPLLNGLEVLRRLRKTKVRTRTIVLSMHAAERYVHQALREGAAGYVLKQSAQEDLLQAIRKVLTGELYLSPPLTQEAIAAYVHSAPVYEDPNQAGHPSLTLRESEVLRLVGEGHTSAEIAKILGISPRTVEHFRAKLMRKLNCNNQAQLIRYALGQKDDNGGELIL